MSQQPGPLETATVDELMDELARRCTAILIITERELPGTTKSEPQFVTRTCWYHVGLTGALGLAEFAKLRIAQGINRTKDSS